MSGMARRESLADLYLRMQSQTGDDDYNEMLLQHMADLGDDERVVKSSQLCIDPSLVAPSAASPIEFSSASSSSSHEDPDEVFENFDESDRDDSDVEPLDLNGSLEDKELDEESDEESEDAPGPNGILLEPEESDTPYIPPTLPERRVAPAPLLASEFPSEVYEPLSSQRPPNSPRLLSSPRLITPSSWLPPRPPRKRRGASPLRAQVQSDEGSDDNATDNEYEPSPRPQPRKRRRASSSPRREKSSSSRHSTRPLSKKPRSAHTSRNEQASSDDLIKAAEKSARAFDFQCPVCDWKQKNRRMPDYQRHLKTHTRPSDDDTERGWWCKGVLLEYRNQYSIPADAEPFMFRGQLRIGGCRRTFSRRDALKRHLDNHNVSCVGRPCAATEE